MVVNIGNADVQTFSPAGALLKTEQAVQPGNDGIVVKESDIGDKGGKGCRFASRCPYVKDQCLTALPPLYKISDQQVASCVLHEAHPVLPATQLTDVLPV